MSQLNLRASPPNLHRVRPRAPGHALADLEVVVPVLARRAQQRVANRIVALNVEQRQAVRVLAAESDAGDPELRDDGPCRSPIRRTGACACARSRSASRSAAASSSGCSSVTVRLCTRLSWYAPKPGRFCGVKPVSSLRL